MKIKKRERKFSDFETDEEYIDFCKYITKLYKDNKDMSLRGLCRYIRQEYHIKAYPQKVRSILVKYGAEIRQQPADNKYKRRRENMTVTWEKHVYYYIKDLDDRFDGKHMRREFLDFMGDIMTGHPSRNLIMWIDDTKPIYILWNKRIENYIMIGDNLSELEKKTLEPMIAQVQESVSLRAIIAYAQSKNFRFWGGHSESKIRNHKINAS